MYIMLINIYLDKGSIINIVQRAWSSGIQILHIFNM